MKGLFLAVVIIFMPLMASGHQNKNEQSACHRNVGANFHCHVS